MSVRVSVEHLADRAEALLARATGERVLLGITGAPGSGKTTLAAALAHTLTSRGITVAQVPMDGFHLADAELDRLGRRDRKGAPDTFDADGYAALLGRIEAGSPRPIYAPAFERDLEQPLAGAIAVSADARIVLTEGNYLLAPLPGWSAARAHLDAVWHLALDADARRARLVTRHVEFGKTPAHAAEWVAAVDEPNARLVDLWAASADLVIEADEY